MKIVAACSFFKPRPSLLLSEDGTVESAFSATQLQKLSADSFAFVDDQKNFYIHQEDRSFQVGQADRIVLQDESHLIAAYDRELHVYALRTAPNGELTANFIKKIKIVEKAEPFEKFVDLKTNKPSGGFQIVTLDSKGVIRVTSLMSNTTVKLDLPDSVEATKLSFLTDSKRQLMVVGKTQVHLVDITTKSVKASSGPISSQRITSFSCSPVNSKLGCVTTLEKKLILLDVQQCKVLSEKTLSGPIGCSLFEDSKTIFVGTLEGALIKCDIEADSVQVVLNVADDCNPNMSEIICGNFTLVPRLPTPCTPIHESEMDSDIDTTGSMTPSQMGKFFTFESPVQKSRQTTPTTKFSTPTGLSSTPLHRSILKQKQIQLSPVQKENEAPNKISKMDTAPSEAIGAAVGNEILAVLQSLRQEVAESRQEVAEARKEAAEQRARSDRLENDMDLLKKYLLPPGVLTGNWRATGKLEDYHKPIFWEEVPDFYTSWPSLAVNETYRWLKKRTEGDDKNGRIQGRFPAAEMAAQNAERLERIEALLKESIKPTGRWSFDANQN